MTHGERLARIEATQEERFKTLFEQLERNNPHPLVERAISKIENLDEKWSDQFKELEASHQKDVSDLKELRNKGKGAFAVLSVVFTFLGVFVTMVWDGITGMTYPSG